MGKVTLVNRQSWIANFLRLPMTIILPHQRAVGGKVYVRTIRERRQMFMGVQQVVDRHGANRIWQVDG